MVEHYFASVISLIMPGLGHILQRNKTGLYLLIITFIFWIIISTVNNLWIGLIYVIYMVIVAYYAYYLPEI
ncbi:MAG: hypothetical protein K1X33_07520 [Methanobacteriaceae archaeon]|nr:hypothetical protein [Methanobacteriaceae archaeon]